ncbi:cytochrome P450 [Gigaspora rosea]|uniref:Cytochrome P450 n=1 Tax=Gigaspora rosea TaxID=44941 RepID=A0A397UP45_9GLOM|nr:cytochrome P450 [Gigaspora rosea]
MGSHIQLISSLTSLPFKEWLTNLFVVILLYIAKYYYTYFTRRNPLPGPFPFPLIGNIHLFHGELDNVFFKLQAKYGEMFEVFIGSERKIWLGNAKLIKKINDPSPKSNFPIRAKGSWINDMRVTDKGIGLNTNLNSWRNNRMMVTKSIMVPSFLRQFVQEVEKFFDELDEYWLVSGNELDFSKWIYKFENDLIIHTFTRKKTCAMAIYHNYISSHNHTTSHLENELRQSEELVNRIHLWQNSIHFFFFIPKLIRSYVPPFNFYQLKYLKNIEWLDKHLTNIVKERRKEIENTPKNETLSSDILTLFICANTERSIRINKEDDDSRPMADNEIMQLMLESITGSVNTAGSTLCFTIYLLCLNPVAKNKVYEEIDRIFCDDKTRPITYDDIIKMTYTEACIKESLRMIPIAPFLYKSSIKEDTIGGLNWKGGQEFFINCNYIHHNETHWSDPKSFIPDRFLDDKKIEENSHMPFGGGVRVCPGRHLGMANIKALMALIFRKYDIELVESEEPFKKLFNFDNRCEKLMISLHLRKSTV